jgi:hypothetical protein
MSYHKKMPKWLRMLLFLQGRLPLAAPDVAGFLQLGVNCTVNSAGCACSTPAALQATCDAVRRLPAVLEPHTACGLIVTAAVCQRPAVLALAACPAIRENVDPPTLAVVLEHTMDVQGGVPQLCETAAAVQLASDVVLQLLLAAVKHGNHAVAAQLCGFSAAQLLTKDEVTSLLFAPGAYSCGCGQLSGAARWLVLRVLACTAQQLTADELTELLTTALQSCSCYSCTASLLSCVDDVCRLPAAQQLSSDVVAALLCKAAQTHIMHMSSEPLCRLPAAQQRSGDDIPVLQLLQAVVPHLDDGSGASAVCSLTAAECMSSSDVAALLRARMAAGPIDFRQTVSALCTLPGAQQLSSHDMASLLQVALENDLWHSESTGHLAQLCALPAATNVGRAVVLGLTEAAAARFGENNVHRLPGLLQRGVGA